MKNFGLFLLFVSMFACKNAEQHKAAITDLNTKWEASTAEIMNFAKIVEGENAKVATAMESAQMDATAMAKLKPEQKTALETAVGNLKLSAGDLGTIMSEINTFGGNWTAKAVEVKALNDGLAAGKIEGDVPAKLTELNALVTEGGTKLASWKESFAKAQAGSNAAQTALAAAMDAIKGKMAPVKK